MLPSWLPCFKCVIKTWLQLVSKYTNVILLQFEGFDKLRTARQAAKIKRWEYRWIVHTFALLRKTISTLASRGAYDAEQLLETRFWLKCSFRPGFHGRCSKVRQLFRILPQATKVGRLTHFIQICCFTKVEIQRHRWTQHVRLGNNLDENLISY